MTGVLPSTSPLATSPFDGGSSRGSLSRSVSSRGTGSRVSLGTVLINRSGFLQDIQCRIVVAIENHTTTMADVRPDAERLLHDRPAVRAFLAGEMGWDCNHRDIMQEPITGKPLQEDPPTGIMDRFGKFAVTDHIADLKVFIGNQVARRDQRVCLLAGKIFALP